MRVTAVIPTYRPNIDVLRRTVDSLAAQCTEVVVVDDGNHNGHDINKVSDGLDNVRVIHTRHKGKGHCLALGFIEAADADIIVTVDDDTIVPEGAVKRLISHFDDSRVGAVAGDVRVANNGGVLTKVVDLEYFWGINFVRTGQSALDAVLITPGAFSAYRRECAYECLPALLRGTIAEDYDLSSEILCKGYKVVYAVGARAFTISPYTTKGLVRQRLRWFRGFLQVSFSKFLSVLKGTLGIEFLITITFCMLGVLVEAFWLLWLSMEGDFLGILWGFLIMYVLYLVQLAVALWKGNDDVPLVYAPLLPLYAIFLLKPITLYSIATYRRRVW